MVSESKTVRALTELADWLSSSRFRPLPFTARVLIVLGLICVRSAVAADSINPDAAVARPQCSLEGGFFNEPVSVALNCLTPGAEIRYSLDFSEPNLGLLYTRPIQINTTTVLRVRAFKPGLAPSPLETHTYLFLDDVIRQAPDGKPPPHFPASWGANAVDYGMDPNVVSKYSLAEWREALLQIPTISVVTELKNLFDPGIGIYANAQQHGKSWERPASLEWFDPAQLVPRQFQENCGFRIRGGWSRNSWYPKHSLRVFFRQEYGPTKLHYPLFESDGAREFDTFDLATSQTYSWAADGETGQHDTMVRDEFSRETLGALGQPTTRSRYCHLYLNGQYWGLYEIQERPEAAYGSTYLGGTKDDYDVVKSANHVGSFVTEASDGDLDAFRKLWLMARTVATNSSNANYFALLGRNADGSRNPNLPVLLDVDNLIDYMLVIFYTGDGDATLSSFLNYDRANNWFGMRNRNAPETGFIFFNHDAEHTLDAPHSQFDRTGPFFSVNQNDFTYANPQWIHQDLMANAEYRLRFADHVQRHFFNDGALTPATCAHRFLHKSGQIDKAIRASSARWGDAQREPPYGESDWRTMINHIVNDWLPRRTGIVLEQLQQDGLYPVISAPSIDSTNNAILLTQQKPRGVIYFTIDGSDPRQVGGGLSPSARPYFEPLSFKPNLQILTRARDGTNWSALAQKQLFSPENFSGLHVTEIMYNPPMFSGIDGEEFEFLELKNSSARTIDLSGLSLTSGISFSFTNGTQLPPGSFFVLVANSSSFRAKYPAVAFHGVFSGKLDNGGETIALEQSSGAKIIELTFDDASPWPQSADGAGHSLVPISPDSVVDPNNPMNWRGSTRSGGSPGSDDPAGEPDSDGDGLPDAWELANGLNPSDATDANKDLDADGHTNFQEYLAGTDPRNRASVLRLDIRNSSQEVLISFASAPKVKYELQRKDGGENTSWQTITNIASAPTSRTLTLPDSRNTAARFYRLKVAPD